MIGAVVMARQSSHFRTTCSCSSSQNTPILATLDDNDRPEDRGCSVLTLLTTLPAHAEWHTLLPAASGGNINTIIGGIAPDWGPFGKVGQQARVMIEVIMAAAILLCLGIAIWGAAKQRIGATALRDSFSAEQGKGLIVAGLTGVFIIGSLGTLFTIVYGMAI
jgi:hypothetical protein